MPASPPDEALPAIRAQLDLLSPEQKDVLLANVLWHVLGDADNAGDQVLDPDRAAMDAADVRGLIADVHEALDEARPPDPAGAACLAQVYDRNAGAGDDPWRPLGGPILLDAQGDDDARRQALEAALDDRLAAAGCTPRVEIRWGPQDVPEPGCAPGFCTVQ